MCFLITVYLDHWIIYRDLKKHVFSFQRKKKTVSHIMHGELLSTKGQPVGSLCMQISHLSPLAALTHSNPYCMPHPPPAVVLSPALRWRFTNLDLLPQSRTCFTTKLPVKRPTKYLSRGSKRVWLSHCLWTERLTKEGVWCEGDLSRRRQ